MARIFLALNGKPIKSLDDLKANFNAKQVLGFYKVKRLQAWLEEQGLTGILEDINSFEEGLDDETLLSMLMAVFELDDAKIAEVEEQIKEQEAAEKAIETEKTALSVILSEESSPMREDESPTQKNDEDADCVDRSQLVTRIKWFLCELPEDVTGDNVEAAAKETKKLALKEYSETPIMERVLFCNGLFLTLFDYTWFKSIDGIHWERDEREHSSDTAIFGYDFIRGEKHCFVLPRSTTSTDGYIYSDDNGWQEIHFSVEDAVARVNTVELGLLDIAEKDDRVYLLAHNKTSKGFFSTNYWYNDIVSGSNGFNESDQEYEVVWDGADDEEGDGILGRIYCFKNKIFALKNETEDSSAAFKYSKIDSEITLKNVNIKAEISDARMFYAFDNMAFVPTDKGVFFSVDGTKWEKSKVNVNADTFYETQGTYIATWVEYDILSSNYFLLSCSNDGISWEEYRISFDGCSPHVAVGNGVVLITYDSIKYLVGKIITDCEPDD